MKVLCIIQARMESSRLPGKVLKKILDKPLIYFVIKAAESSRMIDKVIIGTSRSTLNNNIKSYCDSLSVDCIRESPCEDVLKRYYEASKKFHSEYIVRITGDCPLISFNIIDEVISFAIENKLDYCSNSEPYSLPEGQDVEIFTRKVLHDANKYASSSSDREHVTLWMKRNKEIKKGNFLHKESKYIDMHLSVDHQDEFEQAKKILENLHKYGIHHSPTFAQVEASINELNLKKTNRIMNEGYYKSFLDSAISTSAFPLKLKNSEALLERSNKVIPGGAQTYSKSWMHHIKGVTPIFLRKGYGSYVEDVDGNVFVDLIQGLLPNILGYASEEVNKSAQMQASCGHSFSLPTSVEIELAEKLCKLIPCAEKVRFGKNGSDATAGAVRAARAITGKKRVAVCGYHGWQDWFIGSTSRNIGVPEEVSNLISKFEYGNIESLRSELDKYNNEFAAVIMEPVNFDWSHKEFLTKIRQLCNQKKILLIFDEICSGFHFGLGGAQKIFDVIPDIATFGKALGNGWPISCIVGKAEYMDIFEDAFFSFTFAGDTACMAAALKVIEILENSNAYLKIKNAGIKLRDGANYFASECGFKDSFKLEGHPHWLKFSFEGKADYTAEDLRTYWVQEVTRRGVLILTTFNINASLEEKEIKVCLDAFASAFKSMQNIVENKLNIKNFIDGEAAIPAFSAR